MKVLKHRMHPSPVSRALSRNSSTISTGSVALEEALFLSSNPDESSDIEVTPASRSPHAHLDYEVHLILSLNKKITNKYFF